MRFLSGKERCWVEYEVVFGVYHIEFTVNGNWRGGGTTGCDTYEGAYIYATKVAKSKRYSIERFFKK